ncbi:MAG: hypothetical protein QNJ46_26060 [Leptolyngbyaceae cyanobacterium MO_188.B28]|nr:hypothetical protein [Leptolyngbyaceae cyanobacterium MO_188.B28]
MLKLVRPILMAGSATMAIGFAVALTHKLGANGSAFTGAAAGAIAGMGSASIVMVAFLEYYNRVNLLANSLSALNAFQTQLQELDSQMANLEHKSASDIESLQDSCLSFGRTLRNQKINLKNLANQHTAYAQALAALRKELGGLKGEITERTEEENQRFQMLHAKVSTLRQAVTGDAKTLEDGYRLSKKLSGMSPIFKDIDFGR